MTTGRFAPSPTGDLHLGNLRTALLAWCVAKAQGGRFLIRMEDLTTGSPPPEDVAELEGRQIADLASIGVCSDVEVARSSQRLDLYRDAIADLTEAGLTYPCYCSRREIREAVSAPHDAAGATPYPGTCARLDSRQRGTRAASGDPAALRLRSGGVTIEVSDERCGGSRAFVDDFVLARRDGLPAYNLTVVVDDAAQGVDHVVRGADLIGTTHRQVRLAELLGLTPPRYSHVPLVLGPDGEKLSKSHGAVTITDLAAAGVTPPRIVGAFAASLGMSDLGEEAAISEVRDRIGSVILPREPWVLDAASVFTPEV